MRRLAMLIGFGILGIALTVGVGASQDARKETGGKAKMNMLPQGWKSLKLSAEQKKKVYDIQNKYRTKIDALEEEIEKLRNQSRTEMATVLTDDQKATLRRLTTGEESKTTTTEKKTEK